MYTRCPTCSTCFRVTDRHLAIANGKVRCGQCKLVFNAPEHAIDDLHVNQSTENKNHQPIPPVAPPTPRPTKPEFKKEAPPSPAQQVKPAVMAPTAKDKRKQNVDAVEIKKEKKSVVEKPIFDADATMISDLKVGNKGERDALNLDVSKQDFLNKNKLNQDISIDEENDFDDVFNNDIDLDAAIDELTSETEEAHINEDDNYEEEPVAASKYSTPENNNTDVFVTDAYDATNASSVADILNEMEGQLSLDISEPTQVNQNDVEYDADNEFDFIQLDDEETDPLVTEEEQSETNDDTLRNHFNLEDFGINEEDPSLENTENNSIDEDELFDQVDLSDFQDNVIEDEIILDSKTSIDSELALDNFENDNFKQNNDDADVPFQLRDDIESLQAPIHRRIHPLISFSFVLILLVLSFAQLAYFRSHELVKLIPASRPILVQFCEKVGCHYSGPKDLKKIQLISRDVRLHPKEKKALLISAAMINNAYFSQPYPDIHIRLSDISGNVIAERIFSAKTYMGQLSNPFLLMKSKTPVHINFEVVDPGKDAINFEFTFL